MTKYLISNFSKSEEGTSESSPLLKKENTKETGTEKEKEIELVSQKLKEDLKISNNQKNKKQIPKHIFLTKIFSEIIEDNKHKKENLVKDCFYIKNLSNLKFIDYIKRIFKYLKPENSTIIISLMYIDILLNQKKDELFLTKNNIFKIYLTAIVLAIKYNEDDFYDNNYISKVGGVSFAEMNNLEREFLQIIDYRLYIDYCLFKRYQDYFDELEN
jgi:hypothetical protein